MRSFFKIITLFLIFWICTAVTCRVSLNDTSVPSYINSFYIKQFSNNASNAPLTLGEDFTELLKLKILSDSKLEYSDINPDIEFEGAIQRYTVSSVAPQPGETTQFSRLTIGINVDYFDNKDEEKNWSQTFSFEVDYLADQNLLDIQNNLISQIFEQLAEDVYGKAFRGNW